MGAKHRPGSGGISLFLQTVLLLGAALFVAQAVAAAVVLSLPPPRPDVTPLGELVARLDGKLAPGASGLVQREAPSPPPPPAGLTRGDIFAGEVARALAADPSTIRLWYEPIQPRPGLFGLLPGEPKDPHMVHGALMRNGEAIFVGQVEVTRRIGARWRTVSTGPRATFTPWRQRVAILFALQFAFLIPLGWLFARRLTRPISGFSEGVSRIGRGEAVADIKEEGPLELRLAARALNTMQARIDAYLRERTAMVAAIAHDLRTPLARIAFRMEAAPEALREKVQADIDAMHGMIAQTIDFTRNGDVQQPRQIVDLGVLLQEIAERYAAAGREIVLQGASLAARVRANPLALERLISNLIDNALSYGTTLEVTLSVAADTAEVVVRDDGPGIPPDKIERMFEPFERGDASRNRSHGGTGLGLSIARGIARAHGGDVVLENQPAGGLSASFRLTLAR